MEVDGETANAPHGQKRQSDDDLESEQRLAKRFNLLNVDNIKNLYIPVEPRPAPVVRKRSNAFSDSMNVDDSRDRIYIHDLEEELADIESEEERLVFIPDIEKHLTKVPRSVLQEKGSSNADNQVVLYGVPESLSVPPDRDVVRKAIIESRSRTQSSPQAPIKFTDHSQEDQHIMANSTPPLIGSQEEDAMDLA